MRIRSQSGRNLLVTLRAYRCSMELRQLRYFLAVADELHFGRAAQKLHMSQPPLSLQVSRLEEELGVKLFERSTRHVALTAAGTRFQDSARQILGDLDLAALELREFADGLSGRLSVGFVSSANYTVLPGVLPLFRERRSKVQLTALPLTSAEQCERLRNSALDVGIVRDEGTEDPSLRSEVVFEEELVACLPASHHLARHAEVTAEEICAVPMIAYPRSLMPGFVSRVAAALGACAAEVSVTEEVVHQETALSFVLAGAGTTILPASISQLVPPSIAIVPLAGSPTTRLLAARRADPEQPRLCQAFIDCLHEAAEELQVANSADFTTR
jgi:DNA-binding transcriptional LysR family regulator